MTDRLPLVSVAIWTCDQCEFIAEAIESALNQDYPRIEIVVADDNSIDGTENIVERYARRYPHIIRPVLHRGSRSIVDNVNRALAECRGDLVAILDGDDAYLPGKIGAQVEAFSANPDVVLCRHPVELVDGVTNRVVGLEDPNPEQERATAFDLVARGNFVPTASSMMRRAAMPQNGADTMLRNGPDWLLAIETARRGTILRLPKPLARYRLHPRQISAVAVGEERVLRDALLTLRLVEERFEELAPACPSGRRVVTKWEANRRITRSANLRWTLNGLRLALRHDWRDRRLWQASLVAPIRSAAAAAQRALKRGPTEQPH
jgi:glycosyltransferase involved in cell wall biosynthesis